MTEQEYEEMLEAVDRGVRRGVALALKRHKQAGHSIHIFRDGQIVEIPPDEIQPGPEAEEDLPSGH